MSSLPIIFARRYKHLLFRWTCRSFWYLSICLLLFRIVPPLAPVPAPYLLLLFIPFEDSFLCFVNVTLMSTLLPVHISRTGTYTYPNTYMLQYISFSKSCKLPSILGGKYTNRATFNNLKARYIYSINFLTSRIFVEYVSSMIYRLTHNWDTRPASFYNGKCL